MDERSENVSKKYTAVSICLQQFVDKGLFATTSRDLSKALNLQTAGMYSYFENKDEAVIACAEEAAKKLESDLMNIAVDRISEPYVMMAELKKKAKEMAPMMRFFTQVCSTEKYEERIRPMLSGLSIRYENCAKDLATHLNVDVESIKHFVYMTITAIVNYMVYQEDSYVDPQLRFVAEQISKISDK